MLQGMDLVPREHGPPDGPVVVVVHGGPGPVLDSEGNVVAVQASVSRHQTGEIVTFTINSTPVEVASLRSATGGSEAPSGK